MKTTDLNFKLSSDKLKRNWGWLLALGILFVILGCVGLGMLVGLTIVSMFFFGAMLIICGILQIVDVFKSKYWQGVLWHALIAVFYIIGGVVVIYDPILASVIITAFLAGVLILIGCTRLIMAFSLKKTAGWGWLLFAGIVTIALGIMILMQWPVSGLWVIGLFIALEILVSGWAYIFIALSLRNA